MNSIYQLFLRTCLLTLLVFCCCGPIALYAQQEQTHEIRTINYRIDGNVRDFALSAKLERFAIGSQYPNREGLDAAVEEQNRILNNLRQLESATVTYTLFPNGAKIFIDVLITVVVSGNFVVLPRPKYSSSDGWELGVRIRDYNFLGTLEQFDIAADVLLPNDGRYKLLLKPNVVIPFQLSDLDWYWKSELGIEAPLADRAEDIGIIFNNAIGIYIPVLWYRWNIEFTQGVEFSFDPNDDFYFLRNRLSFGADFSTPIINDPLGRLRYRPTVSTQVKYRFDQEIKDANRGFDFSYDHSLGFDRIRWEQNLREGLVIKATNNNTYNTSTGYIDSDVGLEFIGHFAHQVLGISGRLGGRYYFRFPDVPRIEEVGQFGRGILNSRAKGNVFIYENFDIRLADFRNRNALEAQGGLFADVIIAFDSTRPFNVDEHFHLGVGFEALGYFLNARSIFLRFSIGFDPLVSIRTNSLFGSNNLEIFFGIGHHY